MGEGVVVAGGVLRYDECCFGQIVFRGDLQQMRIGQWPFASRRRIEEADGGGVAGKGLVGEAVHLVARDRGEGSMKEGFGVFGRGAPTEAQHLDVQASLVRWPCACPGVLACG